MAEKTDTTAPVIQPTPTQVQSALPGAPPVSASTLDGIKGLKDGDPVTVLPHYDLYDPYNIVKLPSGVPTVVPWSDWLRAQALYKLVEIQSGGQ